MRADHAVQHNAGVGLLVGLAVGDVLSRSENPPEQICGGPVELPDWGVVASESFSRAEEFLRHAVLDITVSATAITATAIGLASPDASPPLLADPDAALMCSVVRAGLRGELDLALVEEPASAAMAEALQSVALSANFAAAMQRVAPPNRPLAGALAGLCWGPACIPAAWATAVTGEVANRRYGLRQLRRLGERLMQQDAPVAPEPRRSLGPREVAPRLWLSNLHAVPRFVADHPDGAVISLCPTTGAFDGHPIRREFALHDAAGRNVNPRLSAIVDEVLATIETFHAEGRDVLVHCHHGASRTGLVLRAWLLHELGVSVEDATTEAQVRWSKTSTWNTAFTNEIKRRSTVANADNLR